MPIKIAMVVLLATLTVGTSITSANSSYVSTEVNNFVAKIYPKGSHFFWIINDATTETQGELILDINTVLRDRIGEEQAKGRFLLFLVNGKLFAAQRIPLSAEVDCGPEEQV